jgi:hypothetical protein
MEGYNQLNFTGLINDVITLMKYESSFDINASIYEYLNQNSNLRNVEDKTMYSEHEKYIYFVIEEQQVRCSNFDSYLISDEEDHSYCLRYEIEAPALKVCTWRYTEKYKSKGVHIVNELQPKKSIKHINGHYFIDESR